jgi:uncharacterized protein YbjT (DUF2867 family)
MSKYLVTGATGNVGSLVAERLIARGERPGLFVRDVEKARARFGAAVEVFAGDLEDAGTLSAALEGFDALFLVNSGPELAERDEAAARVARAVGVRRLVKLSSLDARQCVGTGVWHARGEAAIRASGIGFAFVQPTGFMSNALYWARSIKACGALRSATGEGRIPFVHPADIAEVAVRALTEPEYEGASLGITGPEALSYREMAGKIAAAIGRTVAFEAISEEEERRQQVAWGATAPLIEARLGIFRAIREGRMAAVTDTVERVTGREPITFDEWARGNAAAFC